MAEQKSNEWYTNKELYELMQQQMTNINTNLQATTTILTEKIGQVGQKMNEMGQEISETKMALKNYNDMSCKIVELEKDLVEVKEERKKKEVELEKKIDKLYIWLQVVGWAGTVAIGVILKGKEVLQFFLPK